MSVNGLISSCAPSSRSSVLRGKPLALPAVGPMAALACICKARTRGLRGKLFTRTCRICEICGQAALLSAEEPAAQRSAWLAGAAALRRLVKAPLLAAKGKSNLVQGASQ